MALTGKKLGWIGTGVMGEPMCGHLLAAGYEVSVYSRSRNKAENLLGAGARWLDSPAEVAACSDIVFTMVGSPAEVRDVYFSENGVFSALLSSSILVDMSSTSPSLSQQIALHALGLGSQAIDAPVSGGDVGARNASLSIMLGGEESAVELVWPLLEVMGKNITYLGPAGSGQHAKLCNQIAVAGTMISVCEALIYAEKSGLECERVIAAIRPGAAGSWTLDNLAPRIVRGDDAPGFMVDHFIKDLGIALSEAESLGLSLPGLTLAHTLYIKTQALGHGQSGTQSLIHALKKLSAEIDM